MAEPINIQDMIDGRLDIKSLGEAANGDENMQVITRLGETYPSAKKAIKLMFENGGVPARPFATKAKMQTDGTALADGSYAMVTDDTVAANYGLYVKTAGVWVKSSYDPLLQSKDYANSNPMFKAVKINAGDDFNNFTKQGVYYHSGQTITSAQISNPPLIVGGNLVTGVLVVRNAADGTKNITCNQTYYPSIDGYSPLFRKVQQSNSDFPVVWDSLQLRSRLKDVQTLSTNGVDVLTLVPESYVISSNAVGQTFLNMPVAPFKFGRLDVSWLSKGSQKQITFTPYGADLNTYENKQGNGGAWAGWQTISPVSELSKSFATKTDVADSVSTTLSTIAGTDYYGKQFTDTEMSGTKIYASSRYAGFNGLTTDSVAFNTVSGRISNTDNGATEYRVYVGDANVKLSVNGYYVPNPASFAYEGVCTSFPKSDTGTAQNIGLDKVISIAANTPFVIVFKNANLALFTIAAHGEVNGNLEPRSFSFALTNADWGGLSSITNPAFPAYTQTGFKLLYKTATSSDGGGVAPEPVDVYTPKLVMPPKIYAMSGLQAHIYPEHLLPEPSDLYLHDVACTRGKQTTRGWEYDVPAGLGASTTALSWSLHDKQTAKLLDSANTSLIIADSAKAGAKNVLVIGDSYVNAGIITQRLLDISATDALKTTLIGTRGVAPNKHEGRGGWKVADYATEGRTYHQFTVTGVTTVPAINSAIYSYNGSSYTVQETAISGGIGTIVCSGGVPITAGSAGILTKTNSSTGDATIAFSNVQPVSGNPFWSNGVVNFGQYVTTNTLATPDLVLIQLGVNDSFGSSTDTDVVTLTTTAFAQLDTLIASIKAQNPMVKIGVVAPNTYANQDAFGANYANTYSAWRAKRNIVTWNRELYSRFKDKEAQNIYVVAAGVNVDTLANFPTTTQPTNSHNATVITTQNNGVHPDVSGYRQIGDAMFAFIKAVS